MIAFMHEPLAVVLTRRHLPMLDGLRAIAIGLVMAFHFGVPISGGLGVNVFFVLSGFLITWLLLREHDETGTISFRNFYARRTLRIFPAYYAFLGLYLALSALKGGDTWTFGNRIAALTYSMDWYMAFNQVGSHVVPLWSLAVEEHFYLIWPLFCALLLARSRRALLTGTLALIAAGVVWRSIASFVFDAGYVYFAFDARLDNLAVGCLLAILLTQPNRAAVAGLERLATRSWLPLITVALLLGQSTVTGVYRNTVGYSVEAGLAAILVAQLLQLRHATLWAWLESAPLRWIGRLSYSLYLYHSLAESVARRLPGVDGLWVRAGAAVAMSLLLASVSFYVVERPFLALKRRFETDRTGHAVVFKPGRLNVSGAAAVSDG